MKINDAGLWGEIFAARYLRDNGYKIVTANYSSRLGEIDIIASKDGFICYVEVKARSENPMFEPKEAVDSFKQEKIIATSKIFEREFNSGLQPRFDVCEVFLNEKYEPTKINYIKNAFNS